MGNDFSRHCITRDGQVEMVLGEGVDLPSTSVLLALLDQSLESSQDVAWNIVDEIFRSSGLRVLAWTSLTHMGGSSPSAFRSMTGRAILRETTDRLRSSIGATMNDDDLTIRLALEQHTSSPRRARKAVLALIGDDAEITFTRDAILLTGELVTNAVIHTDDGCVLTATYNRVLRCLRVEVADTSSLPPRHVEPSMEELGGYGLTLIDNIATRWGSDRLLSGKRVWFELDQAA